MMARWLILLLVTCSALARAASAPEGGEQRLALLIGNAAYDNRPLANPINDVRAMARALNDVGFSVKVRTNLTRSQMRAEIRRFGDELRDKGGVGLFFYAGHGVQVNGRNYLIPVKSDVRREHEVEDEALDANFVISTMESAKAQINIVILDACRDNPFSASFRSSQGGLAPMSTPSGSIIAYATAPGQTAADGSGDNGLYTKHLVEQIGVPGQSILDMFINVRNGVQRESGGRQTPWELSSLTIPFQFRPGTAAAAASGGASQADIDRAVRAALSKREAEDAARRADQQSEIERAVLAALRKREEEQAAAKAGREAQSAQAAIEKLKLELAELRAAKAAPAPSAPAPRAASAPPAQVASAVPTVSRGKPVVAVGGRIERPEIRVGDRWEYVVTDRYTDAKSALATEVVTVTGNRIYTRTGGGAVESGGRNEVIEVWDRDWNLLRQGSVEFTPNYPTGQFPLSEGSKWSGRVTILYAGPAPLHQEFEARAEGWERVTVPAGTFDAIRISVRGHFSVTGVAASGDVTDVYWYAPAVRQFVKKEIQQMASTFRAGIDMEINRHERYERWELTRYKVD